MTTNVVPLGPGNSKATPARRLASVTAVYTVKEVSSLLRLSLASTYALVRDGTIPSKRMGGRWVIPKQRFHAWLDSEEPVGDNDRPAVNGRR